MKYLVVTAFFLPTACTGVIGGSPDESAEGPTPLTPTTPPSKPGDPPIPASCQTGSTPLRRLTRTEYDNTVRQLLGLTGTVSADLPSDEVAEGFDTDVSGQGASPLLAVGYLKAAENLSGRVNLTPLLPCPLATGDDACAQSFIDRFGTRVFRRPLRPAETTQFNTFYRDAKAAHGFEQGIRLVIQLFLSAPQFLYRLELTPSAPGQVVRLTSHEVASRLSYFLWGTMPDEILFTAADAGQLVTKDQVAKQADRMLANSRARVRVRDFAHQWLGMGRIDEVTRDPKLYRGWTDSLAEPMGVQAATFVEKMVFDEQAGYEQLLTASHSYMTAPLATYLGAPAPQGTGFAKVALDPARYSGILTLPGPMAITSTAESSNPIYRGHWVQSHLLCVEVPPPPPSIDVEPPTPKPGLSTRQLFAQHSADPACANCHQLLDAVGFGLENFDATGKWRATDRGVPVNARGELFGVPDALGPFNGAAELGRKLGRSHVAAGCLTSQLFHYSRGRKKTPEDDCALGSIRSLMEAAGGNLRAVLIAMTQSDDFLVKKGL